MAITYGFWHITMLQESESGLPIIGTMAELNSAGVENELAHC